MQTRRVKTKSQSVILSLIPIKPWEVISMTFSITIETFIASLPDLQDNWIWSSWSLETQLETASFEHIRPPP